MYLRYGHLFSGFIVLFNVSSKNSLAWSFINTQQAACFGRKLHLLQVYRELVNIMSLTVLIFHESAQLPGNAWWISHKLPKIIILTHLFEVLLDVELNCWFSEYFHSQWLSKFLGEVKMYVKRKISSKDGIFSTVLGKNLPQRSLAQNYAQRLWPFFSAK